MRAVRTEHDVEVDLRDLGNPVSVLNQGRAALKFGADELVVEENPHIRQFVESV